MKIARQLFHVPCDREIPDVHPTTSVLRCLRCHGYSIQNGTPAQALCESCGRISDTVCASCHNGIHNMAQCAPGSCVNKEYFADATELLPVCHDCMWKWVQFLSTCPSKTSPLQQSEALSIMSANASSFASLHGNSTGFIKHYLRSKPASKSSLIQALQGHRGFKQPSLASAADKIEALIMSGHVEVIKDMCRWNYNCASSSHGVIRNLPSISTSVPRKRSRFLV